MENMDIVFQSIDDLIEYENNPRNNELAIEKVAASIKQFGFKVPIIVDKHNIIVAGHTRLRAAKQLNMESVPTIRAADLTDAQVKAFRIADNRVTEESSWNWDKLRDELNALEEDYDFSDLGFEDYEISDEHVDIDDFFEDTDTKPAEPNEPKEVKCPHCGEHFVLEE